MRRVAWATIVALVSGVIGLAGGYLAVETGYPFSAERRDERLNAGYAGRACRRLRHPPVGRGCRTCDSAACPRLRAGRDRNRGVWPWKADH